MAKQVWYVYLIECGDGRLYTGTTTDVKRRFEQHRTGKGAKFFRTVAPKRVVYSEKLSSRSEALRREVEIKRLRRKDKLRLWRD